MHKSYFATLKNRGSTDKLSAKENPMPRKRTDNRRQWEKENIKSYTIRCNVTTNPDFAEWMENHKPYQDYIKGLVIKDMESHKD